MIIFKKITSCENDNIIEFSDRITIASKGKVDVVLSPEDMVSCDSGDYCCGGGYMENAW